MGWTSNFTNWDLLLLLYLVSLLCTCFQVYQIRVKPLTLFLTEVYSNTPLQVQAPAPSETTWIRTIAAGAVIIPSMPSSSSIIISNPTRSLALRRWCASFLCSSPPWATTLPTPFFKTMIICISLLIRNLYLPTC